ncbi:MAG TPA: lipase family protein, partial [Solirubrobacteraceae bacterium]
MQAIGRRRPTGVALALVAAAAFVPAAWAATPSYGTQSDDTLAPCPAGTVACPASDPFYQAPSNLASLPDGALVGVRPATISGGDPGKTALTISYRSQDSFGAPVLDVATVFLPSTPYIGTGGQPLVSYQFPIDSLGGQCAPSYSFAYGTNENVSTSDIQPLLSAGYVVIAPDFDGPAEQFIAGQQEGHAVLDGIRAAESLPAAGLSRETRVALDGYSGGAHATGWAQELAASYAPDLNIVAAAEGGTPADLTATGNYLDGTVFFGLDFLSNGGLIRAFPGAGIQNYFNAKGRAAVATAGTECVGQALTAYPYQHFNDYTTIPDVIDTPNVQALLTHEKLGQSAPHFPIFSYHVYNDEIVPYTQDVALLQYYCANNVPVDFVTLSGDHISGEFEGAPLVSTYLQGVFGGATPPSDCAAVTADAALPQVPPIRALPRAAVGARAPAARDRPAARDPS